MHRPKGHVHSGQVDWLRGLGWTWSAGVAAGVRQGWAFLQWGGVWGGEGGTQDGKRVHGDGMAGAAGTQMKATAGMCFNG